ncbi:MAG TPA: nicotinamidase [Candidatus Hydrogenedentes bacterium]|mgnify:CR=1 FL=1|nr:nicotinamidase [Candidatus Hydrogenedentota bacterium]HQM47387.1 nicotinamidase [Candidatus Hydrogenedentota bacterium]
MEEVIRVQATDALIVVDIQKDFCRGGALAVEDGDAVVPVLNRLIPKFGCVVFTRDWHPVNHCSFDDEPRFEDKSWPPHCVADTPGAEFHKDLKLPSHAIVINTATEPDEEAYSGFHGTELKERLNERGVARVFVGGLATDYCVKYTVLDAIREGFEVVLVEDACRGIDIPRGTAAEALAEMRQTGAVLVRAEDVK